MKKFMKKVWETLAGKLSALFLIIGIVMTIILIKYASSMELGAIVWFFATCAFYIVSVVSFLCGITHAIIACSPQKHQKLSKIITVCAWICASFCLVINETTYLEGGILRFIFWLGALLLANTPLLKNMVYYGGLIIVGWFFLWFQLIIPLFGSGRSHLYACEYVYPIWAFVLVLIMFGKVYKRWLRKFLIQFIQAL